MDDSLRRRFSVIPVMENVRFMHQLLGQGVNEKSRNSDSQI